MSNVYELRLPAACAAVVEAEPLEEAVREVSRRIAENNQQRRRLFARLDELRGLTPELRRRRARTPAPEVTEPALSLSIEEADADRAQPPLQAVRGGR